MKLQHKPNAHEVAHPITAGLEKHICFTQKLFNKLKRNIDSS